jgi:hypothetical protein
MKKEKWTQGLPLAALTRVAMDANTHARAIANFMMGFEIWGEKKRM